MTTVWDAYHFTFHVKLGRNSRKMGFVALSSQMRQRVISDRGKKKFHVLVLFNWIQALQSHILYQFIIRRR